MSQCKEDFVINLNLAFNWNVNYLLTKRIIISKHDFLCPCSGFWCGGIYVSVAAL